MLWLGLVLLAAGALAAFALPLLSLHGLWLIHLGRRRTRGLGLRVSRADWLTPDLLHLELVHPWRLPLPPAAPGQFLTLIAALPGSRPLRRCYSLASWARLPFRYELCIKREPEGRVSNWLAEHCRPGASLRALPPTGHFHLDDAHGPHLLLIAGGVGITPMRAMLQAWRKRPRGRRATLIYAGRDEAALAYHDEFLQLAADCRDFSYRPMLSRAPEAPAAWQGRLDLRRLEACLADDGDVFVCAGQALLQASREWLDQLGVEDYRVHFEAFGADVLGAGSGSFPMHWQGEALHYDGQPSLLHALREQQVDLPADCWGGHCGSCRVRCSGQVEWRQKPAVKLGQGEILACCCIPREPVLLERIR